MPELRIGTSGWVYAHWKEIYYPAELPQKQWFAHYARDFDTVEINNTFYRLPKPETFEHWGEAAPPGFLYTFKASRFITHIKRLLDPETALENFVSRIRLTGRSLGPVLYQLPPRFSANLPRLETFLQALPADLTRAFEFRDDSWHQGPVRELLERFGAAFCIHDHGLVKCPDWVTADTVYLRYHGSAEAPYSGSYTDRFLQKQAERITKWSGEGKSVYAYFNNDVGGHAVRNALTLKRMVEKCQGKNEGMRSAGRGLPGD